MAVDFSAFKEALPTSEIERLEREYKPGNGQFSDVPSGTYPVEVAKMEVSHVTGGKFGDFDRLNIDFKIIDGDHKGQHIFYNGTFNNKIDSGYRASAQLLSQMTDGDVDENSILHNLESDLSVAQEYVLDLFQAIQGKLSYDLNYTVQEQTKINPQTGQPYKANRWFSIEEVYDM